MDRPLTAWEYAIKYLPDADYAPHDLVRQRLLEDRAQLWLGHECAGVTEISDDNLLHIWTVGGSLRGLMPMLPSIETFAKAHNCGGLEVGGRAGWRKFLIKYGFKPEGEDMVKRYG